MNLAAWWMNLCISVWWDEYLGKVLETYIDIADVYTDVAHIGG
jgi:beta-glucanase (GH16 family)